MFITHLLLTLAITSPSARALDFKVHCLLALTTIKTTGLVPSFELPKLFSGYLTFPPVRLTIRESAEQIRLIRAKLAAQLHRPIEIYEIEPLLTQLSADQTQPREVIETAIHLAHHVPLTDAPKIFENFTHHPRLVEPSELLPILLNPNFPADLIPNLLITILARETRPDASTPPHAVPYGARPAFRIVDLQRAGRIDEPLFLGAFRLMLENPRANADGLYWILRALEGWSAQRTNSHRPPPHAGALIEVARRRLTEVKPAGALGEYLDAHVRRLDDRLNPK